jgi:xylulokinase
LPVRAAIGLDVGTTAVKALAVDEAGTVVARCEVSYPLSVPRPGWAEQDPEDWWRATQQALAGLAVEDVAGIGLSGQMHGLVALDAGARVIRPAILWNDGRSAAECAEIEQRIGLDELIARTGNRALAGFTAPKLLWLRRHEPESYARIARIMLPKDFVRLRLCGEHAIDMADASGTLLLDVRRRRWSDVVLDALEIDRAWLPRLLESPEVSGATPAGVPVAAGAGDQAAGALGVGVDRPGPLSVVLGTSGVVFAALPSFAADADGRAHAFCHAVPGGWHAMGVMLSAAGSLGWLRHVTAPDESYERLLAEAEQWPAAVEGLMFLPYLAGERTPHVDPGARGAFVGLDLRHDRGALVRAVLEGVAFALRDCLEILRPLGVDVQVARVSGGGARSDLWLRIVASVLEVPLERTAAEEGAAFGAALLGGVAGGVFADVQEAVSATVRPTQAIEPEAKWIEPYAAAYDRFRSLYPALRPLEDA